MLVIKSKKTDYDAKISDIEAKYFTTSDYNKFTNKILDKKIKELVEKSDILGFIDNCDLDKKIGTLAAKAELKTEQNKIVKLQAFDFSYFRCKSQFEEDGKQNY